MPEPTGKPQHELPKPQAETGPQQRKISPSTKAIAGRPQPAPQPKPSSEGDGRHKKPPTFGETRAPATTVARKRQITLSIPQVILGPSPYFCWGAAPSWQ